MGRGSALPHALWLLCCLMYNNQVREPCLGREWAGGGDSAHPTPQANRPVQFVRNAARQAGPGLARALLTTLSWAGTQQPHTTVRLREPASRAALQPPYITIQVHKNLDAIKYI